ncbi:FAD-dependent monooxygenase [Streptomyces sp. NPDC005438]|uniref:FAD-dependent monooxygenase n=1 Tax=Streptomyces sp. NPDC005438 TaxID=3156880 RepID=UPI0033AA0A91
MTGDHPGVLIVGAGPVGLTLALLLARYGVRSTVLDASSGEPVRRESRSCVLRPETAAFLPSGLVLQSARWHRWRTERRRQTMQSLDLDSDHSPVHLSQHSLEAALREALSREHLARVVPHSHVDQVEQDDEGVRAHTRGGDGRWWRGAYLVGCDGARSTVRKLIGVRFAGRTSVERHAVATLRVRLPWEEEALLHREMPGSGEEVLARPLPRGLWRLDWLLPPQGELVTPEALLERVRDSLSTWHGVDESELPPYELLDTGVHVCHQRLAQRWRSGRVFLAGDAAHLVGALGVQSVDEGIQDAANLAWKLSVALREPRSARDEEALDTLLDSYERERRTTVGARLRAVDQSLPLVRSERGLRVRLPGKTTRHHLSLLTDGHLGRGPMGAPALYDRSPLAAGKHVLAQSVPVETQVGAPVVDVPVVAANGARGRLRDWCGGPGGELLVLFTAPGTGVWDSRHWLSAGLMPELVSVVSSLPLRTGLLVTEEYPGAPAHSVLVIRADGHLVAATAGVQAEALRDCVVALRGESLREEHRAVGSG